MNVKAHPAVRDLREMILRMGARAEAILETAIRALRERDPGLAEQVKGEDVEIDRLDVAIDEAVLRALALQAPLAEDLRGVVAIKTMAIDLERVGDLARNIAKSAARLAERPSTELPAWLEPLETEALELLRRALDCFEAHDPAAARAVIDADDRIDSLQDDLVRALIARIGAHPETASQAIDLILVAEALERVADHATNIAEDVILIAEARNVKHAGKLAAGNLTGTGGLVRPRILAVDDEPDLLELVRMGLDSAGYEVETASTGAAALDRLRVAPPDLLLLDLMLPDLSGTELCKRIRADARLGELPVIMLTAKGEEVDRVVGFEIGADDYVTKPFSPRELALRVRAVLSRRRLEGPSGGQLRRDPLRVDPERHRCWVKDEEVVLTAKEFQLLVSLMRRPGRVYTRDQLLDEVWGSDITVTSRTIDTHLKRLREKLGEAGPLIETVRGVGYRFAD